MAMKVKKEMPTGQGDGEQREGSAQPHDVEQVVEVDGDEAVVLEPGQEAEEEGQGGPQGDPATDTRCLVDEPSPHLGDGGGGGQEEDETPVPPGVEEVAGHHHERLPRAGVGVEQPLHRVDHGKEDGEVDGGKEHVTYRLSGGGWAMGRAPARRLPGHYPATCAFPVIVG